MLGRGAFADTWLCFDVARRRQVAVKLFKRPISKGSIPALMREIGVQAEVGPRYEWEEKIGGVTVCVQGQTLPVSLFFFNHHHPSSIHLVEVYEVLLLPAQVALVMEARKKKGGRRALILHFFSFIHQPFLLPQVGVGGSLTSYVGEAWASAPPGGLVLPVDMARYLFRQFVDAVAFCHSHNIAHRDLKLDNALLDGSDPPILKLCDFGFAARLDPQLEKAFSHLGTPEYMSPELLRPDGAVERGTKAEAYDPRAADVWAAGVFLCVALLGAFPFDHTKEKTVRGLAAEELDLWLQEVARTWSDSPFLQGNIAALPPDARDLLDKIFVLDPSHRATIDSIRRHPWYAAPLADARLAAALKAMDADQAALDAHLAHRRIDVSKVAARVEALKSLLEAATAPAPAGAAPPHLRPLHTFDGGSACARRGVLARIDLTEASVLADGFRCECASPLLVARGLSHAGEAGGGPVAAPPATNTPFAAAAHQRLTSESQDDGTSVTSRALGTSVTASPATGGGGTSLKSEAATAGGGTSFVISEPPLTSPLGTSIAATVASSEADGGVSAPASVAGTVEK